MYCVAGAVLGLGRVNVNIIQKCHFPGCKGYHSDSGCQDCRGHSPPGIRHLMLGPVVTRPVVTGEQGARPFFVIYDPNSICRVRVRLLLPCSVKTVAQEMFIHHCNYQLL